MRGQRPRGRLERVPVTRVAVGEHVLEIVDELPEGFFLDPLDRRRGEELVLVVDELRQRVREVALPGLEQGVPLARLRVHGEVFEQGDEPEAQRAPQEVVQVLGGSRAIARIPLHPPSRHGHVPPRVEEPEQAPGAVLGAPQPLGERAVEQRSPDVLAQDVVAQAQVPEVAPRLREDTLLHGGSGERECLVRTPQALEGGN